MECRSIGVVISQLPGGRASVVRQKVDVLWRRGLGGMSRRFVISSIRGRKNLRDENTTSTVVAGSDDGR